MPRNDLPYEFKRMGWKRWVVVYTLRRKGAPEGGEIVAVFRGKFALKRAEHRAHLRNLKWFREHRPHAVPPTKRVLTRY